MQTDLIQRQYDEVIAPHYDQDPQGVTVGSLRRAIEQIRTHVRPDAVDPLKVYDVGMGTGLFLQLLGAETGWALQPHGLDLSPRMIETARGRVLGLDAVVDDARNLDAHFPAVAFDLVATHYISGFVPAAVLAEKIHDRLADGGYWSLVGGTKLGFPALQAKGRSPFLQRLVGGTGLAVDDLVCNPADAAEIARTLEAAGFVIRACETFRPAVRFADLAEFLDFAYYGGWLAPFVEALGLHRANPLLRLALNTFVFPVEDHHDIAVVLAQKVTPPA